MSNTAPLPGLNPDVASAQPAQPPAYGSGTGRAPTLSNQTADLRLVIEDDKAAGSYVYMTINSVTGEVVAQIPREQLLKMRESPDYTPGSVVNARS
ncbi:MAG TPA: hypothetical protein VHW60_11340 [Caulobacteraceae bacterium]|jgi:flagellar protein FlaG|nr:hypothetical protein [Caulobacteraceae bacterium]